MLKYCFRFFLNFFKTIEAGREKTEREKSLINVEKL